PLPVLGSSGPLVSLGARSVHGFLGLRISAAPMAAQSPAIKLLGAEPIRRSQARPIGWCRELPVLTSGRGFGPSLFSGGLATSGDGGGQPEEGSPPQEGDSERRNVRIAALKACGASRLGRCPTFGRQI